MNNTLNEYSDLVDYLIHCLGDYEQGKPSITDEEYDVLLTYAYRFETKNPSLIRKDSPTRTVGAELPLSSDTLPHMSRMWSLSNSYTTEQLEKFLKKVKASSFSVECKYDGLAIELVYLNGKLISASLRGSGVSGKDILDKVMEVTKIPKEIPTIDLVVVHGEIVLKKEVYIHINESLVAEKVEVYSSIRSAAAGILRSGGEFLPMLSFKAYEANGPEDLYSDRMLRIATYGFSTTYVEPLIDRDKVADRVLELCELRELYPYPLDGLVIKVNSTQDRERIGYGNKAPKYSIAHKFAPATAKTVVEDIVFTVSGQGLLIPTAKLKPVLIDGFKVSSATLHNLSAMMVLGVYVGDVVEVSRVADVNNQITRVFTAERAEDAHPPIVPTHCPSCQTELNVLTPRRAMLSCPNALSCKEQVVAKIKRYISPAGVNVPLPLPAIERLIETDKLTQIIDLYNLTQKDLVMYGGLSEKMAKVMIDKLLSARTLPFKTHIAVLGIPTVSFAAAEELGKRFDGFQAFLDHFAKTKKTDTLSMSLSDVAIMEWCDRFDNRLMVALLAKFFG